MSKLKKTKIIDEDLITIESDFKKAIINQSHSLYKPKYYKAGEFDVIEFCNRHELGFSEGNIIKYITRAGKKDSKTKLEDLNKAKEYLDRLIKWNNTNIISIDLASKEYGDTYKQLQKEVPDMDEDYYLRNTINIIKNKRLNNE